MSSNYSHLVHIPPPKFANPLGEEPWAYAVLSRWQRCSSLRCSSHEEQDISRSPAHLWPKSAMPNAVLLFALQ